MTPNGRLHPCHGIFIRGSYPPRKVVLSTYRALCEAVRSCGGPVPPARFAHRVKGLKSEREVYSALRILREAGAVEDAAARRDCTVRWIASPAQIEELLRDGGGAGDFPDLVPLLEGLTRASAAGERRLLRLSRREIARWAGGDFGAARAALDALQRAGLLGWRDEGHSAGCLPRDPGSGPEELSLDWERVVARRNLELRKLRRMEKYAFQRGCRRRYILGYFGEHLGRSHCGGCDRCS